MSEVSIQTLSPQRVVSTVLRQLNHEQIEDAVACFTTDFRYKDHGIGLEFRDKEWPGRRWKPGPGRQPEGAG
jgi:hypothetical protein